MNCFVYGSLKKGFQNHRILKDSVFLGKAVTLERYKMYHGTMYPFMLPDVDDEGFFVVGELYFVSDSLVPEIDRFEGVPGLFFRKTISVVLDGESKEAECYFLTNSYGFLMDTPIAEYNI